MNFRTQALSLAIAAIAAPVGASDLEGLKTRSLHGLKGPSQGRDITNKVLGSTALASEGITNLAGRNLRTRFWTINDKGIVPLHDHANRPAVFTVLTGEIYEYSSNLNAPALHPTGGLAVEGGEGAHWWSNKSGEVVQLIAFDVFEPSKGVTKVTQPSQSPVTLPQAKGAQHDLLGAVDMGAHFGTGSGEGWVLSTYRTTIEPGGVFPSFVTNGEPLHGFVWQGQVVEHRAGGTNVLDTHAGTDLSGGQGAWWENTGDTVAVMYWGAVEPKSEIEGLPRVGTLTHGSHGH